MLPFINLFNKIYIPLYGLCIVSGIFIASFFMVRDCKRRKLYWEDSLVIGITGIGIGFLGAKVLYIIVTYGFWDTIVKIFSGDFSNIINSGFVFYGGLIGGILGAFLGAKFAKAKISEHENVLIKLIPLVHAFGRIGCFCAGCCYGRPAAEGTFGIAYTRPLSDAPVGVPLVPVQLYEAGCNLILFAILWFIDRKWNTKFLTPIYIIGYGIERFIMEFFRYDEVRGIFFGVSTSQWISIGMCTAGVILIVIRIILAKKKNAEISQ